MINYCVLCSHNDTCKYKEKRNKLEREIHPFKVYCPFYEKTNVKFPPRYK